MADLTLEERAGLGLMITVEYGAQRFRVDPGYISRHKPYGGQANVAQLLAGLMHFADRSGLSVDQLLADADDRYLSEKGSPAPRRAVAPQAEQGQITTGAVPGAITEPSAAPGPDRQAFDPISADVHYGYATNVFHGCDQYGLTRVHSHDPRHEADLLAGIFSAVRHSTDVPPQNSSDVAVEYDAAVEQARACFAFECEAGGILYHPGDLVTLRAHAEAPLRPDSVGLPGSGWVERYGPKERGERSYLVKFPGEAEPVWLPPSQLQAATAFIAVQTNRGPVTSPADAETQLIELHLDPTAGGKDGPAVRVALTEAVCEWSGISATRLFDGVAQRADELHAERFEAPKILDLDFAPQVAAAGGPVVDGSQSPLGASRPSRNPGTTGHSPSTDQATVRRP